MCDTCGCGSGNQISIRKPGEKEMEMRHDQHGHMHQHDHPDRIEVGENILHRNDLLAERNRAFCLGQNIYTINLVSSPGSGKTTLLEKTLIELKTEIDFNVIEGDQQTFNDADRIDALGIPVVQINTGTGCHLDSEMVSRAMEKLEAKPNSILLIENVGNLVCPSLFDLGENERVVIISVTEGDDKPLKYPDIFHGSQICIINKIDLLPYVNFDINKVKDYALRVNPALKFFEVSATTGDGMQHWYNHLKQKVS